jgi:hypothetical protein
MKREFCLNSRRWIQLMAWKMNLPNSCPYKEDRLATCQDCSYLIMKEESPYLKKILYILKDK